MLPPFVRAELGGQVTAKLLPEYGATFTARGGAVPPDRLVFRDEADVERFQRSVEIGTVEFGLITIELQRPAADALGNAVAEAVSRGLTITPRSADSGRRRFADTVGLWLSRVEPALAHWVALGKLDADRADAIKRLSPSDQVPHIFAR